MAVKKIIWKQYKNIPWLCIGHTNLLRYPHNYSLIFRYISLHPNLQCLQRKLFVGDWNLQQTPVSSINVDVVLHYKWMCCIPSHRKLISVCTYILNQFINLERKIVSTRPSILGVNQIGCNVFFFKISPDNFDLTKGKKYEFLATMVIYEFRL